MVNVLYGGNEKVFDGILISLLSMAKHTASAIHAFVLTIDLREVDPRYRPITNRHAAYLDGMLKAHNPESEFTLLDITEIFKKEFLSSPNLDNGYTPYTLLRLFADRLEAIPDKIVYLDVDTAVCGDFTELYDIDVEAYEFAGVRDYLGRVFIYPNYVNAGMLILNMKKIRETGLLERARDMCVRKKMYFSDQTALNKLVKHKLILPSRFNRQNYIKKDTVVKHFCQTIRFWPFFHVVNVKPWQVEKVHKKLKIHVFDDVLEEYLQRKEAFARDETAR